MHLKSPGQWVRTNLDNESPSIFTFTARKAGWHTIYFANEDDQERTTIDVTIGDVTRPAGGLNGRTAFNLQPGDYSFIAQARSDCTRKVMYYEGAIGVNTKRMG